MPPPAITRFPIAVIGASAAGLDALQSFLGALPPSPGAGFVVVLQHAGERESELTRVIQSMTTMPVMPIEDGIAIRPGVVHVAPFDRFVAFEGGVAHTSPFDRHHTRHAPIDWALGSLAADQGEHAVAVILAGHSIEGMTSLLELKSHGGLALVQDPESSDAPSPPQTAALARHADFVLRPVELAAVLVRYIASVAGRADVAIEALNDEALNHLPTIIALLRARTRYNFEPYKHGTLVRRIRRRMGLRHVVKVDDYLALLRDERDEAEALARDVLIRVTHFFRDPEAWDALRDQALVALVESSEPGATLRVWVPGCATGQEAYSLAMLLLELIEASGKELGVQVFATDIGGQAAALGREGVYTTSNVANLSPQRLARFFVRLADGRLQVSKLLRECVIFAEQDLVGDPPFSRMDLIICRNVLIYLELDVQQRIIALFHFGLVPGGYLFLGPAETIGHNEDLFVSLNKRWRVFQRVGSTRIRRVQLPASGAAARTLEASALDPMPRESSFARLAQQVLLERFAPASVLITPDYEILYYCGPTHRYLTQPAGMPTQNLVDLAGDALRGKIRGAVHRALQDMESVAVVGVTGDDPVRRVKVSVSPISNRRSTAQTMTLLVTFDDVETAKPAGGKGADGEVDETVVAQLEHELGLARDDLQSTIEQLEASNEELKAANEEVTSMNEELQSTNEELETSKEELQSLNEELTTVNAQLQTKVEELEETTNDLQNLLSSTNLATLFLDTDFRIKRFTPAVTELLKLIPGDVGRTVTDFSHTFTGNDLVVSARKVLDSLAASEAEVQTEDGRWFLRRILPYRTEDNRIAGVVVTFSEFTIRKRVEEALRRSEERFRQIADLGLLGIAFFDPRDGAVTQANDAFLTLSGQSADDIAKRRLQLADVAPGALGAAFDEALARMDSGRSRPVELELERRDGAAVHVVFGVALLREGHEAAAFFMDITKRKQAEAEVRALAATLERRVAERSALVRLLSDAAVIANEASDVRAALCDALARVCHELGYRAGHVWMPVAGEAEGTLREVGWWWADEQWSDLAGLEAKLAGHVLAPDGGLASRVANARAARWTREVERDVGWLDQQQLRLWPIRSVLAFPMVVRGRVFGVVELLSSESTPMLDETLAVVARVGEQLGWVLERDESQRAVRRLAGELTHVEQRERARIADVLHEEVGQALTAARMKLGLLRQTDPAIVAELDMVMGCIDEALDAARNTTTDLSPPPMRDLGLMLALRWLARDTERRFGLKVEIVAGPEVARDDAELLDERVGPVLFRAVRELLHNVAKHAGVGVVEVVVSVDANELLVEVDDFGRGFEPSDSPPDSHGLASMKERLSWFGGTLAIESHKGDGTHVRLRVPLAAAVGETPAASPGNAVWAAEPKR